MQRARGGATEEGGGNAGSQRRSTEEGGGMQGARGGAWRSKGAEAGSTLSPRPVCSASFCPCPLTLMRNQTGLWHLPE